MDDETTCWENWTARKGNWSKTDRAHLLGWVISHCISTVLTTNSYSIKMHSFAVKKILNQAFKNHPLELGINPPWCDWSIQGRKSFSHDFLISQYEELIFTLLHWSTTFSSKHYFLLKCVWLLSPIIIFHKFQIKAKFPDFPSENYYKPGKEFPNHPPYFFALNSRLNMLK